MVRNNRKLIIYGAHSPLALDDPEQISVGLEVNFLDWHSPRTSGLCLPRVALWLRLFRLGIPHVPVVCVCRVLIALRWLPYSHLPASSDAPLSARYCLMLYVLLPDYLSLPAFFSCCCLAYLLSQRYL